MGILHNSFEYQIATWSDVLDHMVVEFKSPILAISPDSQTLKRYWNLETRE
jgi:hypothetical protein